MRKRRRGGAAGMVRRRIIGGPSGRGQTLFVLGSTRPIGGGVLS